MDNTTIRPRVSVIVATRNEEQHIHECIKSILQSTLPSEQLEIVVADGQSTDRTQQIVRKLASYNPCVKLIDNARKTAPAGFNEAIRASTGEHICLLSAHAFLAPDYLERCLGTLDSKDVDVVGGPMETLAGSDSAEASLIMALTTHRLGMGSSFRTIRKDGPVDTVVFGVYRRSVFETIGLFDERLVRNQDNELNSRLRASGGRVWMAADARSYYYNRSTFGRLIRQNYRNGLYNILTWRINPDSFCLRHAIPLAFVLFLLAGAVLPSIGGLLRLAYFGVLALYMVLATAASVQQMIRFRRPVIVLLPFAFLALHISYGIGSLVGIFRFGLTKITGPAPETLPPRQSAT